MLCSDLVELVRGVVVKLEQQTIVLVHNGYECIVLVGDVSMSIVLDGSHGYEVILVLWRIDDLTTVGMVSDLVKADSSVTDTADSVLGRSDVGQWACIAKDANIRVVIEGIVVETIVLELFPLMHDLRDMTTDSVPGLGGVLNGCSSVSGTGEPLRDPPILLETCTRSPIAQGTMMVLPRVSPYRTRQERLCPRAKLLGWMVGCADSRLDRGNESLRCHRPWTHGCENVRL